MKISPLAIETLFAIHHGTSDNLNNEGLRQLLELGLIQQDRDACLAEPTTSSTPHGPDCFELTAAGEAEYARITGVDVTRAEFAQLYQSILSADAKAEAEAKRLSLADAQRKLAIKEVRYLADRAVQSYNDYAEKWNAALADAASHGLTIKYRPDSRWSGKVVTAVFDVHAGREILEIV